MNRIRRQDLAVGFAVLQLADAAGSELLPRRWVQAHLDHLGVPRRTQRLLPAIKMLSSAGLLLGLRWPRFGTVTSVCLIGYYAAAMRFHLNAPEHPIMAAPAGAFGLGAATVLLVVYLPSALLCE